MGTGKFKAGCNPAMDMYPIQGAGTLSRFMLEKPEINKHRPDGPLGSYTD